MSDLIRLSCTVADIYHRYHEIHGTLFGATLVRRMFDAMRGKHQRQYTEIVATLAGLVEELVKLEKEIRNPVIDGPVTGADRELRKVLLGYTRNLNRAVDSLAGIYENLERDEIAYRRLGVDGRSRFTADKMKYDQLLSELERLGTRLEKLFANY